MPCWHIFTKVGPAVAAAVQEAVRGLRWEARIAPGVRATSRCPGPGAQDRVDLRHAALFAADHHAEAALRAEDAP